MTCEELQHGYEPYIFGTLEAGERAKLEAHLARAPMAAPFPPPATAPISVPQGRPASNHLGRPAVLADAPLIRFLMPVPHRSVALESSASVMHHYAYADNAQPE